MSERIESAVQRLQKWCLHHVWWLAVLNVLLAVSLLIRDSLESRPSASRWLSVVFHLSGAVFFWWVSKRVKKLEAERRQKLELEGALPQP